MDVYQNMKPAKAMWNKKRKCNKIFKQKIKQEKRIKSCDYNSNKTKREQGESYMGRKEYKFRVSRNKRSSRAPCIENCK